jgi:hypothetical protein
MSLDVSALSAYIEDRDFPLIGEAQVAPEMTAGEVTVVPGLKGTSNIHYMDTTVTLQDGSDCTRTPNDTTTFSDKTISVVPIGVYEDLCLEDMRGKWLQILMAKGTQEGREVLPSEVAEVYFEEKSRKLAQSLDIADWQSNALYEGWLDAIDNSIDFVNGNPTGITAVTGITTANIISILQTMWQLQTDELAEMDDVTIYLSKVNYDKYILALINADLYNYMGADGDTMLFGTNVKIRPTYGLKGSDRIVLTYPKNLILGVDGENDKDFSYRIDPVTNKKILVDADFTRGCAIYFTDQVVNFEFAP